MLSQVSKIMICCLLAVSVSGCAVFSKKKPAVGPADVVEGKVLNPGALKQGGKVLIVPFTAGEAVAETDVLQKISLRLVRGLSEELKAQGNLEILSGEENPQQADFVIKGRIVRLIEKKGMPKVVKARSVTRTVAVRGELVSRRKNETIAIFSDDVKSAIGQEDFGLLAERLGQRIGAFIVSQAHY